MCGKVDGFDATRCSRARGVSGTKLRSLGRAMVESFVTLHPSAATDSLSLHGRITIDTSLLPLNATNFGKTPSLQCLPYNGVAADKVPEAAGLVGAAAGPRFKTPPPPHQTHQP